MPFQNVFGPARVTCHCGLVIERSGYFLPMPLRKVVVKAEVVDFISELTITQEYVNYTSEPLQTFYFFPIEESAAVVEFESEIDGRKVKTVVKEKEDARSDYSSAVSKGQSAFLLEEDKPDIFKVLVGNLPPGSSAKIDIKLIGELFSEEAAVQLIVPTYIAPRYIPPNDDSDEAKEIAKIPFTDWSKEVPLSVEISVKSTSKIKNISSISHDIRHEIKDDADKNGYFCSRASLETHNNQMDRDFILKIDLEDPYSPRLYVEKSDAFQSTAAMLSFIPSFALDDHKIELVFLIDRSGSMSGTPVEQAKSALLLYLHSLPPDCYFNIVSFGTNYSTLFPESVKNSDDSLRLALEHAKSMTANFGGTEIMKPLQSILTSKPIPLYLRQVFVLTDGLVSNSDEVLSLVRSHSDRSRVFALGIGREASRYLVKGIARNGGGTAQFAMDGRCLRSKVLAQLKDALQPAVSEIKITWVGISFAEDEVTRDEGVTMLKTLLGYRKKKAQALQSNKKPKIQMAPFLVPPVFDGHRLLVFAIFENNELPSGITMKALSPDGPLEINLSLEKDKIVSGDFIHKMAARKLIQDLEEGSSYYHKSSLTPSNDLLKSEIIQLSEKYGLVSRHASFVGVDNANKKQVKDVFSFCYPLNDDPRSKKLPSTRKCKAKLANFTEFRQMESRNNDSSSEDEGFALFSSGSLEMLNCQNQQEFQIMSNFDGYSMKSVNKAEEQMLRETESLEKDLIKLISCQSFDGEFRLDAFSLSMAGKSKEKLDEIFNNLKISASFADTILALAILKTKFMAIKSSWELVYNKSYKWLSRGKKMQKYQVEEMISFIEDAIKAE